MNLRGSDHALTTCKGLADAHIARKEYPNALHFLTEAVDILETEFKDKPDEMFGVILMRKATCQFRCGEQEQAIGVFERGMDMFRKAGGKEQSESFASFLWSFQV